jgi:hypothetical protein
LVTQDESNRKAEVTVESRRIRNGYHGRYVGNVCEGARVLRACDEAVGKPQNQTG